MLAKFQRLARDERGIGFLDAPEARQHPGPLPQHEGRLPIEALRHLQRLVEAVQ